MRELHHRDDKILVLAGENGWFQINLCEPGPPKPA
jgi:hypothetical protein